MDSERLNELGRSKERDGVVSVRKERPRPARVQVDPESIEVDGKPEQTGTVFNVWYSKWSGGDSSASVQTHSKTRVDIARDSGYTRADSKKSERYICLYFARGLCCMGKKCEYLHRLPTVNDKLPPTKDCFGRDKFADYRADMAGVGSFLKENRTLYIGHINDINEEGIELKINKNFKEFGQLVKTRVIHSKNILFVTYAHESNAQFAKEAMANQALDKNNVNEALSVRWANEDPDPEAQKRNKRRFEQDTLNTVKLLLSKFDAAEAHEAAAAADAAQQVEEVEEPEEPEDEARNQPKLLTEGVKGLDIIRQLLLKRRKTNVQLVSGYSSDED